jgi:hypothetical protein
MASFLKRTANASFVPRLLSMGPSMSASVYRGLRGCNMRCRGRITRDSYGAQRVPRAGSGSGKLGADDAPTSGAARLRPRN